MENLEFSKSYYPFTVPDCVMKALIPETSAGYGIRQPVPALIALTPDRMDAFLQAYPENGATPAGSTACAAGPGSPNWNFVKISGTILPRNARPSEYDIGIMVSSRGKVIAEFRFNETLTLEQQVSFERYVRSGPTRWTCSTASGSIFTKRHKFKWIRGPRHHGRHAGPHAQAGGG